MYQGLNKENSVGTRSGGRLSECRLAVLVSCCCLFVLLSSFPFQTYVMPQLDAEDLPLSERVRSGKFGDTYGYGVLAEGILRHGELRGVDGTPILKHMPALPLSLAATFGVFGSARPFLIFQVLFLFVSLYFLLARIRNGFPAVAVVAMPILIALHPQTIKHSAAVMSDLLFGSILLWVVFLLWKRTPSYRDFLWVGVVFGIAVYVRESAFPFMLLTGLAYVVKDRRKYLGPTALMACTFLALLSPWVIRNQLLTGEIIPLTTKSSDLFYYYSIPLTTELYSPFGAGFQEGGYDYVKLSEVYHQEAQSWGGGRTGPGQNIYARESPSDSTAREPVFKDSYSPWTNRPLPSRPIAEGLRNYVSRPGEQFSSFLLKSIALFNKPPILAQLASTSLSGFLVAANIVFYAFHIGTILFGVVLSFTARNNPFIFLPYWITAQYFQSMFFWSEHRYLMPFYPLLILISLAWYWNRRKSRARCSHILQGSVRDTV